MTDRDLLYAALGIGAGVLAWVVLKGGIRNTAQSVGSGAVGVAVDVVDGIGSGLVMGVGDVIGIPRTECHSCRDSMDRFAVAPWYEQAYLSFSVASNCTAGDYARWLGNAGYRPVCK